MFVERGNIEVCEGCVVREAIDVGRVEPAISDGALRGLCADLARGPTGRRGVFGLADPDDRDLARNVFQLGRVSPIGSFPHGLARYRRRL